MKTLVKELESRKFASIDELREFLRSRYRVAIITKAEHGRLKPDLPDEDDVFSRYRCPEDGFGFDEL
jgi:hypothetical protein